MMRRNQCRTTSSCGLILIIYFTILSILPAHAMYGSRSVIVNPPETITGIVKDYKGQPIPGVSIKVESTKNGTVTDNDGRFILNKVPADAMLVISYIGYIEQRVKAAGEKMNIVLLENVNELDQIVVVGYGTQKKSDITGSISSVPKDRLQNLPVTNVLQAMQGSVAGVNISTSSSAPGSSPSFYIRGLHSITASNDPLIVLDGIPFSGTYNDINTTDIQSIDVLKDASATAIYGPEVLMVLY
ncbi:TonB-dependent receptor plug domain-containing protein [Pedobacter sp. NJ-S-72]